MSDAPEQMHIREKPNGALGLWHDATSSAETAAIANGSGTQNPFHTYIRLDLYEAEIARLREELATARDRALEDAAEICEGIRTRIANGPMPEGARFDYEQAIHALKGAKP